MLSSLIYGDRCHDDCRIWQNVDRSCALSIKNKVCSCSQIPTFYRGRNHKWHFYLRALTLLMKGKTSASMLALQPFSTGHHHPNSFSLSLSLYISSHLCFHFPFFFFRRLFSLSLSQFQLYHHFQVTRLRRWTQVEESGSDTGPSMWLHVLTKTRIYTY